VKLSFDTSTLVASLVSHHPHHDACWPWFETVVRGEHEGNLCVHVLVELYATLTVLPVRPAPTPTEVRQILQGSVLPHFKTVELRTRDYVRALDLVSQRLLRSGAVFDALIEIAARKSSSNHLVTLNTNDFKRLCDDADVWLIDPRQRSVP